MKRILLLLLFGCCWGVVFGQTVEIEEAFLNAAVKSKKWTTDGIQERGRMWKLIKDKYPILPYDTTTGKIKVQHVIEFPGITKAQAFRRVKEWGALNFPDLESVIDYEDFESGKIIMEGWVRVWYSASAENLWGNVKSFPDERRLLFSLVITIKDGKAKVEYENLQYKYRIIGYVNSLNIYVPAQEFVFPLIAAFPLVNDSPDKWEGAVDLMRETMKSLNATAPSIEQYIRSISDDYRF